MSRTIKTTIHTYAIDLRSKGGYDAYQKLHETLCSTPGRGAWLNTWSESGKRLVIDDGPIELETEHLFSNQWNASIGRVFDWYEEYDPRSSIKRGHYLDITDEMREIRRNTYACGYCGKQEPAAKGYVFCPRTECLGSPYLKHTDLCLLRMQSVARDETRAPLTDAELAHLLPQYEAAQQARRQREIVKKRAGHAKKLAQAQTEHEGMVWLLDHGFDTSRWIYYAHEDRFCYGWRDKVSDEDAARWLAVASEAPFAYKVIGKSRTWESYVEPSESADA